MTVPTHRYQTEAAAKAVATRFNRRPVDQRSRAFNLSYPGRIVAQAVGREVIYINQDD